jgi:ATP-dependent Zn protease
MRSTTKTILIWILILVAAVGLYTFAERGTGYSPQLITLTELITRVDADEVLDVTIQGSNLRGHLKAKPDEEFRSVIPSDYSRIYDKLTEGRVNVKILPPDSNSWPGNIPVWLVVAGSVLWFAISVVVLVLVVDLSRFVKRQLARSGGNPSTT